MCGNCSNCKSCGSSADGSLTDVAQIKALVNKYFPQPSEAALNEAYKYTMVYLEFKKLPVTEDSILKNKDQLDSIIKKPDLLKQMVDEHNSTSSKDPYKRMFIVAACLIGIYLIVNNL